MAVTILHTADWQLGKPLGSIEGDLAALLREERLNVVARLADLARERQVDAILVAGDVFDSSTVPDQVLRRALEAVRAYSGPWVLLPGNHDPALAESPWTRLQQLGLPENIRPAAVREPLLLAGGKLAVLPSPLTRRHEPDDVTDWMDDCETPPGAARIGLAHGSVAGRKRIEDCLSAWRGRLRYLEGDFDNLIDEPSADDLDTIDLGGFVRAAVERLLANVIDSANPQREIARTALRLLYFEHKIARG